MNIIQSIWGRLMQMLGPKETHKMDMAIRVGPDMRTALKSWDDLFYLQNQPQHSLKMAQVITSFAATLTTNEIMLSLGTGARADYLHNQLEAHLLPDLWSNIQLAAVGGQVAVKPYVRDKNLYFEVIPASRIYPSRFGPGRRIDAGCFTDYDTLNGRSVVRVERFDLQPGGLYINNRAYYDNNGELGGEVKLTDVPRWAELPADLLINNVDRPYFGILRMPGTNTVDGGPLPVSLYANAVDAIMEMDRIYAEYLWEIHTGKRRLILDRLAVQSPIEGKPAIPYSELTSDYYVVLDFGNEPKQPWGDYTPEMRVEAYQKAMDVQARVLELQVNLSPGTIHMDIRTGRVTATQVVSDDKETYNTIKAIQDRGIKQGLLDVMYWCDVYATLYDLAPEGPVEPAVSFGDSIFEDTGVEFQRRKQLADGKYIRPELLTSWYFGVSEDEARSMAPETETGMFGDA